MENTFVTCLDCGTGSNLKFSIQVQKCARIIALKHRYYGTVLFYLGQTFTVNK